METTMTIPGILRKIEEPAEPAEPAEPEAPEVNYPESTLRAIQNSLKLMVGKYGGAFYVKYLMDEGTCYGWLDLIVVYPDGAYKSIILFKNSFRETDTESGNGVYREKTTETKTATKKTKLFPPWVGPDELNSFVPMMEYETPTMKIPEVTIWKKILENFDAIPITKINQTATLEQLLDELQTCAAERAKEYGQGFMDDTNQYYISSEDFREIIEANGWNVSQARTQMDMMGLFEKDSGTRGYQKSKRVGGEIKRFYVVRKNPAPVTVVPKSLKNTEYSKFYKTEAEEQMDSLRMENRELVDKYNAILLKYDPEQEKDLAIF